MSVLAAGAGTSDFNNMTSKPRGTYLDPLKACALSGVSSSFLTGKSESSTFTKFSGITRQTRRNASRTSVLNDVEKTRFTAVMKRIDTEKAYSVSVLERQARMFRTSLVDIDKHKRSLLKQADSQKTKLDPFGGQSMSSKQHDGSVPDLLRRHKGKSNRRKRPSVSGIRSKAKKRTFKPRLPNIANESITETEDESGFKTNERTMASLKCPPNYQRDISNSKPSKRIRGGLTLPVFMKPETMQPSSGYGEDSDDASKATGSTFYTANKMDITRPRRFSDTLSEDISSSRSGKLKLPAINSNSQVHLPTS